MTLKQVVLPAPLGPIKPRISPGWMSKCTSLSAVSPPNCMVTWSISSKPCWSMGASFHVWVALGDISERVELVGFSTAGAQLARDQTGRAEDHHDHQQDAEDEVAPRVDEPQPFGEVADQHRSADHSGH